MPSGAPSEADLRGAPFRGNNALVYPGSCLHKTSFKTTLFRTTLAIGLTYSIGYQHNPIRLPQHVFA